MKTKTDLFIDRVKLFKNKELREKAYDKMNNKTQTMVMNLIKKCIKDT